MTFDEIMTDLQNSKFKPIYLLMGEEPYYIDKISDYIIAHALTEEEKSFNYTLVYGKDAEVSMVDNLSRRYPMMSKYQLIVVKEAQNLKKIEDLVYYSQKPSLQTILVICYKYGTVDKRKKLLKEIDKIGVVFESKKLYENQVPLWITNYLKGRTLTIGPESSAMLTEYLGNDLSKIANELDKLAIVLPKGTRITPEIIETNIGISKDYNTFELQNALVKRDILKANRIVKYFGANQRDNPIVVTITSLYFFFAKLLLFHFIKDKSPGGIASALQINPYFVKDYEAAGRNFDTRKTVAVISILREFDAKSKGVGSTNVDPGELLKEMVFRILH